MKRNDWGSVYSVYQYALLQLKFKETQSHSQISEKISPRLLMMYIRQLYHIVTQGQMTMTITDYYFL